MLVIGMTNVRTSARLLQRRHWFLLYVLGAAAFFEGYDLNIVAVALPQLRHSFHLTQADASLWIGALFLGALPGVLFTRQADRRGRRLVLLVAILGYTVATGFTALATSIAMFAGCQFFARLFLSTENALAWTMVAEELPAGSRGFGFGWLSMLAALGTGTSAIIYGRVLVPNHLSWRWLYVLALPPLIGVFFLRRRLPESRRFVRARDQGVLADRWRQILQPPHRRWLFLLCVTAMLAALTTHAATFAVDFMETQRHLSASSSSNLIVAAGAPAVVVLLLGGALSDRYGRKLVGCSFALLAVIGALDFFFIARSWLELWLALAVTFVGTFGAGPALGAFGSELFPTSLRALGGSSVAIARVLGQAISLGVGGVLLHLFGNFQDTVAVLVLGPVAMIVIVACWFPETHGRELEEISYEPGIGLALGPVLGSVPGPLSSPANLIEPMSEP
jgi:MFS transporter, putative metabolite:H+ symporter